MAERSRINLENDRYSFYEHMEEINNWQLKLFGREASMVQLERVFKNRVKKVNSLLGQSGIFDIEFCIDVEDLDSSGIAYYCRDNILLQETIETAEYEEEYDLYLPVMHSGLEVVSESINDFEEYDLKLRWPRIVHLLNTTSVDLERPPEKDQDVQILALPLESTDVIRVDD